MGITHTPGVCGGRACIRDTRIPVWSILEAKKMGANDLELLQSFQGLNAEDITNAMRYYHGHKDEVDADISDQILTLSNEFDGYDHAAPEVRPQG